MSVSIAIQNTYISVMRKIQFYILSLWLLFPLVAIKEFNIVAREWLFSPAGIWNCLHANIIPFICFVFLLMGLLFYYRFTYKLKGSTGLPEKIVKIEDQNYEHLTFLTTYIIPFLRVKQEGRDILITVLLLIIIGAIFVQTNLFYKNPTLALLGYKLYKCDLESGNSVIFISKINLKKDQNVYPVHISDNIYFATI